MAFTNESTSTLQDLVTKLNTWMGANGWTSDRFDTAAGVWAMSRTGTGYDIRFVATWDTSSPGSLALYHFFGSAYSSGSDPWAQGTADSGNGAESSSNATITTQRHCPVTNSPVQYWAFEDDHYTHVAVESAVGKVVYFGIGQLDKLNDWTGGEFVYGTRLNSSGTGAGGSQIQGAFEYSLGPMDGSFRDRTSVTDTITNAEEHAATVRISGLPGQNGSAVFAVLLDATQTTIGTDRNGDPRERFVWGYRSGPVNHAFARFSGSDASRVQPVWPLPVAYYDVGTSGDVYPVGYVPGALGCNMSGLTLGQTIDVGGTTYRVFPARALGSGVDQSGNLGVAFAEVA